MNVEGYYSYLRTPEGSLDANLARRLRPEKTSTVYRRFWLPILLNDDDVYLNAQPELRLISQYPLECMFLDSNFAALASFPCHSSVV